MAQFRSSVDDIISHDSSDQNRVQHTRYTAA